jgi:hypothetical protein
MWGYRSISKPAAWTLAAACLLSACHQAPARESRAPDALARRTVTFNRDIAPILFQHCATCHRPVDERSAAGSDDVLCVAGAPFSLLTYASARDHARQIAAATASRAMPPWLPRARTAGFRERAGLA